MVRSDVQKIKICKKYRWWSTRESFQNEPTSEVILTQLKKKKWNPQILSCVLHACTNDLPPL
jgi:hypothetical protein